MKPTEYLSFYAEYFSTVEVDSTFYACPSAKTVANWNARTPADFVFSIKVPKTITHDKMLVGCDPELKEFFRAMDLLGPKLGPIVFQFPLFTRNVMRDRHDFFDRLLPFLTKLPSCHKFAVEIRNPAWLDAELAVSCAITKLRSFCRTAPGCLILRNSNLIQLPPAGPTFAG
jgi:uncharacterized protein YecE (DUF72 family)